MGAAEKNEINLFYTVLLENDRKKSEFSSTIFSKTAEIFFKNSAVFGKIMEFFFCHFPEKRLFTPAPS